MKTRLLILLLLSAVFTNAWCTETLMLQKALDHKQVKAKVWSLGGHSGYCIRMELTNLSRKALVIEVEAGRRLNSLVDEEQDILVVRQQTVELRPGEIKTTDLKGYCCQASNLSPAKRSEYSVNKMAEMPLFLVARYLNANSFDPDVEQKSVWAVSEDRSAATIAGTVDSLSKPLREMVAAVKGEKLPWYVLLTKTIVSPRGSITILPIQLKGEIPYANEKDNYVTMLVLNEKGLPVCQTKSEWMKASANGTYNVRLPVKDLPKGRYTLELKTLDKRLAAESFEI